MLADSSCVEAVCCGLQWADCPHGYAVEVPVRVCVELHSSRVLIITQQPFSQLTVQRSEVRCLCCPLRAGAHYLKSFLVIFFIGMRWTWLIMSRWVTVVMTSQRCNVNQQCHLANHKVIFYILSQADANEWVWLCGAVELPGIFYNVLYNLRCFILGGRPHERALLFFLFFKLSLYQACCWENFHHWIIYISYYWIYWSTASVLFTLKAKSDACYNREPSSPDPWGLTPGQTHNWSFLLQAAHVLIIPRWQRSYELSELFTSGRTLYSCNHLAAK